MSVTNTGIEYPRNTVAGAWKCLIIVVGTLAAFGFIVYGISWYASLPVRYMYPDGSCALDVKFTSEGRMARECGAFGNKTTGGYTIGWNEDITKFHDGL